MTNDLQFLMIAAVMLASIGEAIHQPPPPAKQLPTTTPLTSVNILNCSVAVFDYQQNNVGSNTNCTVAGPEGVSMKRFFDQDLWKTHVIMACTVTAAVEVFVIIMMLTYWKQLRWSLRKIQCPCCDRQRRNRNNRQAQANGSLMYDEVESLAAAGDNDESFDNLSLGDVPLENDIVVSLRNANSAASDDSVIVTSSVPVITVHMDSPDSEVVPRNTVQPTLDSELRVDERPLSASTPVDDCFDVQVQPACLVPTNPRADGCKLPDI